MSIRNPAAAEPGSPAPATEGADLPGGPEISGLSFEAARDALAEVVRRLEGGTTSLEGALALWERGEQLGDHCQQWLEGARRRVARLQEPGPDPEPGGPEQS